MLKHTQKQQPQNPKEIQVAGPAPAPAPAPAPVPAEVQADNFDFQFPMMEVEDQVMEEATTDHVNLSALEQTIRHMQDRGNKLLQNSKILAGRTEYYTKTQVNKSVQYTKTHVEQTVRRTQRHVEQRDIVLWPVRGNFPQDRNQEDDSPEIFNPVHGTLQFSRDFQSLGFEYEHLFGELPYIVLQNPSGTDEKSAVPIGYYHKKMDRKSIVDIISRIAAGRATRKDEKLPETVEIGSVIPYLASKCNGGFDSIRKVLVFLGIPPIRTAGHEVGHFDQFNRQFGKLAYGRLQEFGVEICNQCLDLHNIIVNENPQYMDQEPQHGLEVSYLRILLRDGRYQYVRVNYANGVHPKYDENVATDNGVRSHEFDKYFQQIMEKIHETREKLVGATTMEKWRSLPTDGDPDAGYWIAETRCKNPEQIPDFVRHQLYQYCIEVISKVGKDVQTENGKNFTSYLRNFVERTPKLQAPKPLSLSPQQR